jgi:hypothetical protein
VDHYSTEITTSTELTELGRVVKPYLKQLDKSAYDAKRKAGKLLASRGRDASYFK